MDTNSEKHSYHFNITEVVDGKIQEVMNFNFGGHHDLLGLTKVVEESEGLKTKHAMELVVGLRLMHHALKKYPGNQTFANFLMQLNDFKHSLNNQ